MELSSWNGWAGNNGEENKIVTLGPEICENVDILCMNKIIIIIIIIIIIN